MIAELEHGSYEAARHLFDAPHVEYVIDAVIAGSSPGRVWVDDSSGPKSALLWDKGHRYYIAGRLDNADFDASLNALITDEIYPAAGEMAKFVIVYCTQDGWEDRLGQVFGDRALTMRDRRLYRLDHVSIPDWRDRVPSGFSIVPITLDLLTASGLVNADSVVEEIQSCWPVFERFFEKGFGFCALHGEEIACWCTAEYVSGDHCGIGIETVEQYQGQGLATLTASAFVDHCASNGIHPHWDCWTSNVPSVRVAEKVGFENAVDYRVYAG